MVILVGLIEAENRANSVSVSSDIIILLLHYSLINSDVVKELYLFMWPTLDLFWGKKTLYNEQFVFQSI